MLARFLILAVLTVPLAEIALFVALGQWIGFWPTFLGIFVTGALGLLVLRSHGLTMLAQARRSMASGTMPARAIGDGMLVALAGLLLLVPGYLTDLAALVLLVPPVRSALLDGLARRVRVVTPHRPAGPEVIELEDDRWRPK